MIVEDSESLYNWLCEVLPPVCSADPNILAKYIIALLRKDRPENHLRQSCLSQLKIFLLECTEQFVDNLFDALKHKKYIKNKDSGEKSANGKSRRNDRRRTRKSSKRKSSDERSGLKRRSKDSDSDTGFNDSSKDGKSTESRHEKGNARNEMRRPFCKDFEEVGVCVLGDCCPYDHGPHPLSVGTALLKKSVQEKEGDLATLNPIQSVISNPLPVINANLFGMLESYNPELPAVNYSHKQRPLSRNIITVVNNSEPLPRESKFKGTGTWARPVSQKDAKDKNAPAEQHDYKNKSNGVQQNLTDQYSINRSCCALEVKKIPIEFNNITKLNEHFSKFGKIVNVGISFDGCPDSALIVFSNPKEAEAAYKCPEPVFSNRFVKVFWHNSKQLKPSALQEPKPAPVPKPVYYDPSVFKTVRNNPTDLKRKHEDKKLQVHLKILDELLAKQKMLLKKLEFAKSLQEKKPILKTLEEVAAVVAKQNSYLKSYQTNTSIQSKRRAVAGPSTIENAAVINKKSLFSKTNVRVSKPAEEASTLTEEEESELSRVSVAQIPTDFIPSVVSIFKDLGAIDVHLGRENEVIATFPKRSAAEKVIVNGIKVNDLCLMVSWYSNPDVPDLEKFETLSNDDTFAKETNDDLKIQEEDDDEEPARFWRAH